MQITEVFQGYSDAEALVVKKLSSDRYICKVYVLFLVSYLLILCRHKLHLMHNRAAVEANELIYNGDQNDTSNFVDVEMSVDDTFDPEFGEIAENKFISFRYIGVHSQLPINPRVS